VVALVDHLEHLFCRGALVASSVTTGGLPTARTRLASQDGYPESSSGGFFPIPSEVYFWATIALTVAKGRPKMPPDEEFELELVTTRQEIGANILTFYQTARLHPVRTRSLLNSTTYWVASPGGSGRGEVHVAPSKWAGYKTMTFERYEHAAEGRCSGTRFDGHITRKAIEAATGEIYTQDSGLAETLVQAGGAYNCRAESRGII